MVNGVLLALGGLGIFLLGMSVMTSGLTALAHDRLRNMLARSTKSALGGAITGTISTALVQSSSATIVAAIGFVAAGLLTFSQALGIIYGANVGTTITGWLVALFGFKIKLGVAVLPFILAGILTHLFGSGRLKSAGYAVAGFGLIFVGIGFLQDGMTAFSDFVTPKTFPDNTWVGRFLLVIIGLLITIVTQSSSAGVAMAITAVHAGNISLAQAGALVIGMDVGTTATALIATIGGKVSTRRTGVAHVIYNLFTGVAAYLFLPVYLWLLQISSPTAIENQPEICLVGFHTLMNILGVLAVLPFTNQFAELIERIIPETGNPLTQRLDPQLQKMPDVAISAVTSTCTDLTSDCFRRLASRLQSGSGGTAEQQEQFLSAVQQTEKFLQGINLPAEASSTATSIGAGPNRMVQQYQGAMHVLDHLQRLERRLEEDTRLKTLLNIPAIQTSLQRLATTALENAEGATALTGEKEEEYHEEYRQLKTLEKDFRHQSILLAAEGKLTIADAVQQADAVRALRRMGYHVWRILHHLTTDFPPRT